MAGKTPKKKDRPGVDRMGRSELHYAAAEGDLKKVEELVAAGCSVSLADDQPFLTPEIDSAHLSKLFTGASFLDQTLNAFTFSYDPVNPLPDSMQLRRWDVYVDPEKNTIKRIYIVKQSGGSTIQLTWTRDWCQISTILQDDVKMVKVEKMIWGF